jgi:hypothetical protein
MIRSRRNFLRMIAAGTAAVAARPARTLASTVAPATKPAAKPAKPAPGAGASTKPTAAPAALRKGIEQQQRDLDKALKTLRDYPLLAGSSPAFGFEVRRVVRPRRTS